MMRLLVGSLLLALLFTGAQKAQAISFFSPRPSTPPAGGPKACNPAKSIDIKTWILLEKTCSSTKNYQRMEKWQCQNTVKEKKVLDLNCKKPKPSPSVKPSPTPVPSVQPSANPTVSPSPSSLPSPSPSPQSFLVKPYLVYPKDKSKYPEYEVAVKNYMNELKAWYKEKVGETFNFEPLQVMTSQYNYNTMRCDPNPFDASPPSQDCLNNQNRIDGDWPMYMNMAIHNGGLNWDNYDIALIFGAGGGGYAGGVWFGQGFGGWAIVGDWVLEPISGKPSAWGIPCFYSDGWQCSGGVPKGTPAHEAGHAFGLPHPDVNLYPGQSIMRWHGDYPGVGFLPHEVEFLKNSPFFN